MPFERASHSKIKKINRRAVFRFLYNGEAQSMQDIAYALKLSIPTVTQNINDLLAMGLLMEQGEFESTGGRKAKAIKVNHKAKYAVGLNITTNHVNIVIIDLGCNVIHFSSHFLHAVNEPNYFENIGHLIRQSIRVSGVDTEKILGVGIGVPVIVSEDHQLATYGPLIGFTGGHLSQFSPYIDYPCIMCNDANAAGFAEIWHRGTAENMVYISLSNSVGGAVLINGSICSGSNQRAGEIGHMTILPDGPRCYCGQKGCLDAVCNARNLSNLTNDNLDSFFVQMEEKGAFKEQWETYLQNLAIAICNLRMTLDSNIVLGGYVGSHMDKHIDTLKDLVAKRNPFEDTADYLDVCTYKFEATAVGSALHYISEFIADI